MADRKCHFCLEFLANLQSLKFKFCFSWENFCFENNPLYGINVRIGCVRVTIKVWNIDDNHCKCMKNILRIKFIYMYVYTSRAKSTLILKSSSNA